MNQRFIAIVLGVFALNVSPLYAAEEFVHQEGTSELSLEDLVKDATAEKGDASKTRTVCTYVNGALDHCSWTITLTLQQGTITGTGSSTNTNYCMRLGCKASIIVAAPTTPTPSNP